MLLRTGYSRQTEDQSGVFVQRRVYYNGKYNGFPEYGFESFDITATHADMVALPAVDPDHPTDNEINTVADALATTAYNNWITTNQLDNSDRALKGAEELIVP